MGGQFADMLDEFMDRGVFEARDPRGRVVRVECPEPTGLDQLEWRRAARDVLAPAVSEAYPGFED